MRQGNFAGLPAIYDPAGISGGQRQPFAGNQVPATRRDSVATALLAECLFQTCRGLRRTCLRQGISTAM